MSHRGTAFFVTILATLTLLGINGCATNRNLKITEVSLDAVELYLDEPRANSLDLTGQKLRYMNSQGDDKEVDLFGTLPGGGWLIVWQGTPGTATSYSGVPFSDNYVNFFGRNVPGIHVSDGFFSKPQSETFAYRVYGRGTRYIFPFFIFYDDTDDVVKFGGVTQGSPAVPRPDIGGTFQETGQLGANKTRDPGPGGRTISRQWNYDQNSIPVAPIDTDNENDWERVRDNLGAPTPP